MKPERCIRGEEVRETETRKGGRRGVTNNSLKKRLTDKEILTKEGSFLLLFIEDIERKK